MGSRDYNIGIKWARDDERDSLLSPIIYHLNFASGYDLEITPSITPLKVASQLHPLELFGAAIFTSNVNSYLRICNQNNLKIVSCGGEAQVSIDPGIKTREVIKYILLKPRFVFEECNTELKRALAVRLIHEARADCAIDSNLNLDLQIEPLLIWS